MTLTAPLIKKILFLTLLSSKIIDFNITQEHSFFCEILFDFFYENHEMSA